MCEDCHCSDLKANSPVLKPRQGRPYIHTDGSVRYQPLPPMEHPSSPEASKAAPSPSAS